jgi:hypothetical protein
MANIQQNGNYNSTLFTNSVDINNFFKNLNSSGFSDWFNKNIKQTSPWTIGENGTSKTYTISQTNFDIIWANLPIIFGRPSINLVEFLCICSIMINETGGSFVPISEVVNKTSNIKSPGIAYAFNAEGKRSYNTLSGNKTAYQSFNDSVYIAAHGTKPMSDILKNTTDTTWSGTVFPNGFSGLTPEGETSPNGKQNGFLIEADFFKFRGRGFIQTTSRINYKDLIKYVIDYNGSDAIVLSTKKEWSKYNGNLDVIASSSTNEQWDTLFMQKNFIIANYAVYVHSKSGGNYSTINPNQEPINLKNSIINVASKIAGGGPNTSYAKLFEQRVQVQLDLINKGTNGILQPIAESTKPEAESENGRLETTGQDPNSQVGNDKGVTGTLSIITNLFAPTAKPNPISFSANGS